MSRGPGILPGGATLATTEHLPLLEVDAQITYSQPYGIKELSVPTSANSCLVPSAVVNKMCMFVGEISHLCPEEQLQCSYFVALVQVSFGRAHWLPSIIKQFGVWFLSEWCPGDRSCLVSCRKQRESEHSCEAAHPLPKGSQIRSLWKKAMPAHAEVPRWVPPSMSATSTAQWRSVALKSESTLKLQAIPFDPPRCFCRGLDLNPCRKAESPPLPLPFPRGFASGLDPNPHQQRGRVQSIMWQCHIDQQAGTASRESSWAILQCHAASKALVVKPMQFHFSPPFLLGLGCGLVPFSLHFHWSCRRGLSWSITAEVCDLLWPALPGFSNTPGPHMVVKLKNSFMCSKRTVNLRFPYLVYRISGFSCLLGCRIGEAQNPGPGIHTDVQFAVINPTAVLNKAEVISEVGAHVVLASETSATLLTQQSMRGPFQQQGFQCFWGHPVPEQVQTKSSQCKRGLSIGTAVFSKLPGRPSPTPLSPEQEASCRISECFVRVGPVEIKVVVIYGWPTGTPEAAARNNLLLAWAYERVTASSIPAIIGGGFNTPPQSLPVWNSFAQLGWVEAGQFVAQAFGYNLPNTCKGATRNDTFILPPVLQQFVVGADVLSEAMLFDSHAPMRLMMRFPGRLPPVLHWKLPKAFSDFDLPVPELSKAYQSPSRTNCCLAEVADDQGLVALRTWSAAVEEAASSVLCARAAQEPHLQWPTSLPTAYSGRCRPRERVERIMPQLPRRARSGHPEPCSESTSIRSKQKLRQWRRLHVLQQGVRKLQSSVQGPAYTVLLRPQDTRVDFLLGFSLGLNFLSCPFSCPAWTV